MNSTNLTILFCLASAAFSGLVRGQTEGSAASGQELQAVIDSYKQQGLLNVGTAKKQVIELLGQPHQSREMPWGIRLAYGTIAIDFRDEKVYELLKLTGATEELFDASHVVDVELGNSPPWHVGIRQKGDGLTSALFFRDGESIAKWNEMVAIERLVGQAKNKTMDDIVVRTLEQIKANQSKVETVVIEKDETNAIFAVSYPAGDSLPAKQEVVRLWLSPRDLYRLAYTHQGALPSQAEGEKWLKTLKDAKLKPYDPSNSSTSLAFSPNNQVKRIAEDIRSDLKKAAQYKPTEQALGAIAATEEGKKKLLAYCDSIYKEIEKGGPACSPGQTEIIVFGPAAEVLPGGYTDTRQHFNVAVKFYGFKYVVPGETSGMSFDGAFEVNGKWYLLPKAHRAFR